MTTDNQREAESLSERLTRNIRDAFTKHGDEERLRIPSVRAAMFENLFIVACGSMCAEIGITKATKLINEIIEAEQKHFCEHRDKKIKVVQGWHGGVG